MENQINQPIENAPEVSVEQPAEQPQINQDKLKNYLEKLKLEQNLVFGLGAAFVAAIAGALIWAVVTVVTNYQIGYMAIAVGFIVGYANRYAGKGIDKIFGVAGAIFALFGCALGNYLSVVGFAANAENLGYFEAFSMIPLSSVPDIMVEAFSPMDLLFYGLAGYEGYKFSFRVITEEEITANAA